VQTHPERARELKIFVDVGEQDDIWRDRVTAFHDLLTQLGIPHTWNTWPGVHDAVYWGGHTTDYLLFYGAALGS
jgi:enterochelin esterase-like enzyme